jgi:pimeloyl-ACP methyl ester carboxylesterase
MTDITIDNGSAKLAASTYGASDAAPILFLHGLAQCRDTWDEIAREMASRHSVWTLDFRGHGHSTHAASYRLVDYISDAEAVLAALGRPAVVIGHSLGGCVAGLLAQKGHTHVRAVFLEDPPWYLGEEAEWQRSAFPRIFPIVGAKQASLQQARAPLSAFLEFVSNAPSPMGGIARDHTSARHLLSQASALQRQDNRCWANTPAGPDGLFATLATEQPFQCPAKIIQSDARMGAALLDGHEIRLKKINPSAEIVLYEQCGHAPHRTRAFEARFFDDVAAFVARFA